MATRLPPPDWAFRRAVAGDLAIAAEAQRRGALRTNWRPDPFPGSTKVLDGPPSAWLKRQGWPTPWWSFLDRGAAFLRVVLAEEVRFDAALRDSGAELFVPEESHVVSDRELAELDALYAETEDMGTLGRRPTRWGELVADLREMRRAVEAGVELEVDGRRLAGFNTFYTWAHGRYPGLEDGWDEWIGDDG
jgi:hypothetical protein